MFWHKLKKVSESEILELIHAVRKLSQELAQEQKNFSNFQKEITARIAILESDIMAKLASLSESLCQHERWDAVKFHETESSLRKDFDFAISGLCKTFDRRLETLGEKRGIVVDLLKRIAELEDSDVSAKNSDS